MLPDFSKPAFGLVALSALRFRTAEDGGGPGPYQSDYRCQLRYASDPPEVPDAEVRVYFVGREKVNAGDDAPALLAFLDWERQRERCHEGSVFELREGARVTATGVVHTIAARRSGNCILFAINDKDAAFIIRGHGTSPNPTELGPLREVGRVETGLVLEQAVRIEDEAGRQLTLRRVELHLDEPTEDGETIIRLLTNVPAESMTAQQVAKLYRRRWSIESMFGRLESVFQSEVAGLGNPRAELLVFGVACMTCNILAVLQLAVGWL